MVVVLWCPMGGYPWVVVGVIICLLVCLCDELLYVCVGVCMGGFVEVAQVGGVGVMGDVVGG